MVPLPLTDSQLPLPHSPSSSSSPDHQGLFGLWQTAVQTYPAVEGVEIGRLAPDDRSLARSTQGNQGDFAPEIFLNPFKHPPLRASVLSDETPRSVTSVDHHGGQEGVGAAVREGEEDMSGGVNHAPQRFEPSFDLFL